MTASDVPRVRVRPRLAGRAAAWPDSVFTPRLTIAEVAPIARIPRAAARLPAGPVSGERRRRSQARACDLVGRVGEPAHGRSSAGAGTLATAA